MKEKITAVVSLWLSRCKWNLLILLFFSVRATGQSCSTSQMVKLNTPSTITIDGTVDSIWSKAISNPITHVTVGTLQPGFSASWKGIWDSSYLYLLVQVKDTALRPYPGTDTIFNFDAVEIFLDGNHSRTATYDGIHDFQYLFSYYLGAGGVQAIGKGPNDPSGTDISGISYAVQNTGDGYDMEIRIPWSANTTGSSAPPDTLGFDINVDDNWHNTGKRGGQVQWNATDSEAYTDPRDFGTTPLLDCAPATPPSGCGTSQMVKLNAPADITIDGAVDSTWTKVTSNFITHTTVGTLQPGFSASWKGMWDSSYLYLLVQVKDTALRPYPGTDTIFNFDAVEIFLDGNHSRTATYDGIHDFQYLFSYYLGAGGVQAIGKGPNDPSGTDISGISYAVQNTGDGYDMEIRVPWSANTTGSSGPPDTLGFDINVDDNWHNTGKRGGQVQWNAADSEAYTDPQDFGTVPMDDCLPSSPPVIHCGASQFVKLNAPSTIVVNGSPDAVWSAVASNPVTHVTVGTLQPGFSASWKGMWDSSYLYLLVQVKDTALRPYPGTDTIFNFDAVEIFLDGNHSRTATYDGIHDFQYLFSYYLGAGGVQAIGKGPNDPSGTDISGISYAVQNTGDGYDMEIRVPWSANTTGSSAPPDTLGFDINVDDNWHNTGKRSGQVQWNATDSEAYNNPREFGTTPLINCLPPPVTITDTATSDTTIIITIDRSDTCKYSLTYTPLNGKTPVTIVSNTPVDTLIIPEGVAPHHTIHLIDSCTFQEVLDTFYTQPPYVTEDPNHPGDPHNPGGPTDTLIIHIHDPGDSSGGNNGHCKYQVTYTPLNGGSPITIVTDTPVATILIPGGLAPARRVQAVDSCTGHVITDTFYSPLIITNCLLTDSVIKISVTNGNTGPYSIIYMPVNESPVVYRSVLPLDTIRLDKPIATYYTIQVVDSSTMQTAIDTFYTPAKLSISDSVLTDTTIRIYINGGNRYTCTTGSSGPPVVNPPPSGPPGGPGSPTDTNCIYRITYIPADGVPATIFSRSRDTILSIAGGIDSNYIIEIIDSCTLEYASDTLTHASSGPLTLTYVNSTGETCNGHDGTITVHASGGKYPYSYSYSYNGGAPVPTDATLTELVSGNYVVTVTDASGATASTNVITIAPWTQHGLIWKTF